MPRNHKLQQTSGGNPNYPYTVSYRNPDNTLVVIRNDITHTEFRAGIVFTAPDDATELMAQSNSPLCASHAGETAAIPPQPSPSPSVTPSPSLSPSPTPSITPTPSGISRTSVEFKFSVLPEAQTDPNTTCDDAGGTLSVVTTEYNAFLLDGDTSHITRVYLISGAAYDGANGYFRVDNLGQPNPMKAFKIASDGTTSTHNTATNCVSPSPTPSNSPTPSITPSNSPTPSPTPSPSPNFNSIIVIGGLSNSQDLCAATEAYSLTVTTAEYQAYLSQGTPITKFYDSVFSAVYNGQNEWYFIYGEAQPPIKAFTIDESGNAGNRTNVTCPSPSPTPSITPSPTPTISVSPSITPTISVSPSITPTISVSPSITPTPSPSVTQGLFLNGNLLTSDPSTPYSANIALSNNTFNDLTQIGAGSYTISGNISGSGAIRSLIGAGKVVTLSGNNSQVDASTSYYCDSGTIAFANASALSTGFLIINNGTVQFKNSAFPNGTHISINRIISYQNSNSFLDFEGNGTSENPLTFDGGDIEIRTGSNLRITRSSGGSGTTNIASDFSGAGTLEIGNTNGGNVLSPTSKGKFIPLSGSAFINFTGTIKLSDGANLALISGGYLAAAAGNNLAFGFGDVSYLSLARQTTTIINQISGIGYILTDSPTVTSGIAGLTINSGDGAEVVGIGNSNGNLGLSTGYNLISLDKVSSGTFRTTSDSGNDYQGGTTIDGGTINLRNNRGLGTNTVVVNAAGTLNKNGFTPTNNIVNNGGNVNP